MEAMEYLLPFMKYGLKGVSVIIVGLSFLLLLRARKSSVPGDKYASLVKGFMYTGVFLAVISFASDGWQSAFKRVNVGLSGNWRYKVIADNGKYEHGGTCQISQNGPVLRLAGMRHWKWENRNGIMSESHVKYSWNSDWAEVSEDGSVRFTYHITTADGGLHGFVRVQPDTAFGRVSRLEGELYQLPPIRPIHGTLLMDRLEEIVRTQDTTSRWTTYVSSPSKFEHESSVLWLCASLSTVLLFIIIVVRDRKKEATGTTPSGLEKFRWRFRFQLLVLVGIAASLSTGLMAALFGVPFRLLLSGESRSTLIWTIPIAVSGIVMIWLSHMVSGEMGKTILSLCAGIIVGFLMTIIN